MTAKRLRLFCAPGNVVQMDAELMRARQSFSQNLLVPTAAMLQGDFSGFNPIYDPGTANSQKIKQPFAGNQIPANRIGAFAKTIPKGAWITDGDWDHTLWGGELLLCDRGTSRRVAHFRVLPMPGAERAIPEP